MITRLFLRALMALNALLPLLRPAMRFVVEGIAAVALWSGFILALWGHEIAGAASFIAGAIVINRIMQPEFNKMDEQQGKIMESQKWLEEHRKEKERKAMLERQRQVYRAADLPPPAWPDADDPPSLRDETPEEFWSRQPQKQRDPSRYTTGDDASWEEFCKAAGIWFPRDRKGKKES